MRPASLPAAAGVSLLVCALFVGLWAWLGRPIPLPDVPDGRLECLSYAPSNGNTAPQDKGFTLPPGQIERDMAHLKTMTSCIRIYSSVGHEGEAIPAAAAAGLKVLVGIWIGADDKRNEKEINAALTLAHAYPQAVRALVVGNEVLLRREMTGERLAEIIRSVKARTTLPVTYADIYEFWHRNPVVVDAVDLMTVHVLPYWDDPTPVSIDKVQAHVRTIIDRARTRYPGKPLQIGEIGWPSSGRTRGEAAPTLVNEARFLREFAQQAHALGVPYNVIEGIDQPWKRRPEGTVGGFWGVLDANRDPKFPLAGPVSEWPRWELAAAAAVLGAALALIVTPGFGAALPLAAWGGIALTGATTGSLLWAFGAQALDFAIGPTTVLWGLYLWGLIGAAGYFIARALAGAAPLSPAVSQRWRWLVLAPAAFAALTMAADGRHRDFLTLAFALPMLSLLWERVCATRPGSVPQTRVAEAWMGAMLLVGGPLTIDSVLNTESQARAPASWAGWAGWAAGAAGWAAGALGSSAGAEAAKAPGARRARDIKAAAGGTTRETRQRKGSICERTLLNGVDKIRRTATGRGALGPGPCLTSTPIGSANSGARRKEARTINP